MYYSFLGIAVHALQHHQAETRGILSPSRGWAIIASSSFVHWNAEKNAVRSREDWENTAGSMKSLAEVRMKPGIPGDGLIQETENHPPEPRSTGDTRIRPAGGSQL
jgi:hypothetical protein